MEAEAWAVPARAGNPVMLPESSGSLRISDMTARVSGGFKGDQVRNISTANGREWTRRKMILIGEPSPEDSRSFASIRGEKISRAAATRCGWGLSVKIWVLEAEPRHFVAKGRSFGKRPGYSGGIPGYSGKRLGNFFERPGYFFGRPGYSSKRPGSPGRRPGSCGGGNG
jgi:hypothetical protein